MYGPDVSNLSIGYRTKATSSLAFASLCAFDQNCRRLLEALSQNYLCSCFVLTHFAVTLGTF